MIHVLVFHSLVNVPLVVVEVVHLITVEIDIHVVVVAVVVGVVVVVVIMIHLEIVVVIHRDKMIGKMNTQFFVLLK
jgi:hypothetical protein